MVPLFSFRFLVCDNIDLFSRCRKRGFSVYYLSYSM